MTDLVRPAPDLIQRAMTDDGAFRVITARCTQTVSGALEAQKTHGQTARHLGDLITGSIMIRETMAPGLRVQGILKRAKTPGYLLGDSHPSGKARGLVGGALHGEFQIENAMLQMMRTLQDGSLHQGVVSVPDAGTVSDALMVYMQESEQITSMIVAGTLLEHGRVLAAGGYLIQLLPNAPVGPLAVMTERLSDFKQLDQVLGNPAFSPEWLMSELLYGMPYTELGQAQLKYACWCSRTSVLGALASLNRSEVQSMVDDGDVLEISCDYCAKEYRVSPAQLKGLLNKN